VPALAAWLPGVPVDEPPAAEQVMLGDHERLVVDIAIAVGYAVLRMARQADLARDKRHMDGFQRRTVPSVLKYGDRGWSEAPRGFHQSIPDMLPDISATTP